MAFCASFCFFHLEIWNLRWVAFLGRRDALPRFGVALCVWLMKSDASLWPFELGKNDPTLYVFLSFGDGVPRPGVAFCVGVLHF